MSLMFIFFLMMILVLITLLFMLNSFFFKNKTKNNMFSIEAGFFSMSKSTQNSYSMQFIMIMLIFITFDLEILFISSILFKMNMFMMMFFSMFIFFTLIMEWYMNTLKWLI